MTTLLVRCEGPMQSWGTRSRFGDRDTETFVSKSGILGLLAAALGRSRTAPLDDLAALAVSVRVDREGQRERDYQTAQGVAKADGSKGETVLSQRHYLADASFLVGIEGDPSLLATAHAALARPHWPLYLGRRGYVPSVPPYLPDGLVASDSLDALRTFQWPPATARLLAYVESTSEQGGHLVRDVPSSFATMDRRYVQRWIRPTWLEAAGSEETGARDVP